MFNIKNEVDYLEKTIKAAMKYNFNELDFNSEAALIRHFEVIGGIAKELERYKIKPKTISENITWKSAISMRDKISHSYFTLDTSYLKIAIQDLEILLESIPQLRKELKL